jgi:hypothetical protein
MGEGSQCDGRGPMALGPMSIPCIAHVFRLNGSYCRSLGPLDPLRRSLRFYSRVSHARAGGVTTLPIRDRESRVRASLRGRRPVTVCYCRLRARVCACTVFPMIDVAVNPVSVAVIDGISGLAS